MRLLKNSADSGGELLAAIIALVDANAMGPSLQFGYLFKCSAMSTYRAIRPTDAFKGFSGLFLGKL